MCAALSDADRAAARRAPDGQLSLDGSLDGAGVGVRMLDIPPRTFERGLQQGGQLGAVVRPPHALRHARPSRSSGWRSAASGTTFRALQRGVRRRCRWRGPARPGAEARAVVQDYHLTLVPRMLAERRPGIRIAHFCAHPVGAAGVLQDPARRGRPRGAGRACSARTTPGSSASAGPTRSWTAARRFSARRWTAPPGRCGYRGHLTTVGVHPLGVDAAELRGRAAAAGRAGTRRGAGRGRPRGRG